ncbi:MAG: TolC family protein [Burkholderiaceae bacterium]
MNTTRHVAGRRAPIHRSLRIRRIAPPLWAAVLTLAVHAPATGAGAVWSVSLYDRPSNTPEATLSVVPLPGVPLPSDQPLESESGLLDPLADTYPASGPVAADAQGSPLDETQAVARTSEVPAVAAITVAADRAPASADWLTPAQVPFLGKQALTVALVEAIPTENASDPIDVDPDLVALAPDPLGGASDPEAAPPLLAEPSTLATMSEPTPAEASPAPGPKAAGAPPVAADKDAPKPDGDAVDPIETAPATGTLALSPLAGRDEVALGAATRFAKDLPRFERADLAETVRRALDSSDELGAARARLRSAEAMVDVAGGAFLPTLDLRLNGGREKSRPGSQLDEQSGEPVAQSIHQRGDSTVILRQALLDFPATAELERQRALARASGSPAAPRATRSRWKPPTRISSCCATSSRPNSRPSTRSRSRACWRM